MRRSVASGFLALAWLYPLLSLVGTALGWNSPDVLLPSGPALIDSNRTLLFVLALGAFCCSQGSRTRSSLLSNRPKVLGFLFLFQVVASSVFGGNPVDSALFSFTWFGAVCALISAQRLLPKKMSFSHRAFLVHLPLTVISLASLVPLVLDAEALKVAGPFQLTNIYSNWLLLCLPLVLIDLKASKSKAHTCLTLLTLVCCLSSLYLTNSRTAWVLTALEISLVLLVLQGVPRSKILGWVAVMLIGIVAALFFRTQLGGVGFIIVVISSIMIAPVIEAVFLGRDRRALQKLSLVLLLTAGMIALVIMLHPSDNLTSHSTERMDNLVKGDDSTLSRTDFWRAAFNITNAHPLLGTGPDTFSKHYPKYQNRYYFYSDSPHCTFLELTSETGWVGGLLFLLFLVTYLRSSQTRIKADPLRSVVFIGFLIGLAHAQVDVTYQYAELWTTLAIILAILGRADEEAEEKPSDSSLGPILLYLLAVTALYYIAQTQRQYEYSRAIENDLRSYQLSYLASERLPGWSPPILRALETGLYLLGEEPEGRQRSNLQAQLADLSQKALTFAPDNASSHRLAGEVALEQGLLEQAEENFLQALARDQFNHPLIYFGLFKVALARGKTDQATQWAHRVLARYPLAELANANGAHQQSLVHQLISSLYGLMDFLSPWKNPTETEPAYRFLLEFHKGPRAMHGLGISLYTQGKLDEAYPLLEEAHRLNPMFPLPPRR